MRILYRRVYKVIKWVFRIALFLLGFIVLLFFSSEWIWPEFCGSHKLGETLYALDWKNNDQIIVYCESEDLSGRTCYGGTSIIPNEVFAEGDWVRSTKHDKHWIIAKTYNYSTDHHKYFIIDKNFTKEGTESHEITHKYYCTIKDSVSTNVFYSYLNQYYVFSYNDSIAFANECEKRGIKLKWKK